ncbi:SPASM domain-containing protein [Enterococcus faecium]|nr:SPASM domain-containing protein [Enterococcus faecium]
MNKVFDCVKSSDQMQLSSTGFPITHCGAGITTLSIDPLGNVYPCVKLHNADFKITNLTRSTAVVDIKNNRNRVLENELVDSVDKCKNCSIKYICGGGCRAEEYYVSKNKQSYSQCDLQKGNLTYFLENINE